MSSHPTPSPSSGSSDSGLDNIRAGVNRITDWVKYGVVVLLLVGIAFYLYAGGAWWAGTGSNNTQGGGNCPGRMFTVTSAYGEVQVVSRQPCQVRINPLQGTYMSVYDQFGRQIGEWVHGAVPKQIPVDIYQLAGSPNEVLVAQVIQCPENTPGNNMSACN